MGAAPHLVQQRCRAHLLKHVEPIVGGWAVVRQGHGDAVSQQLRHRGYAVAQLHVTFRTVDDNGAASDDAVQVIRRQVGTLRQRHARAQQTSLRQPGDGRRFAGRRPAGGSMGLSPQIEPFGQLGGPGQQRLAAQAGRGGRQQHTQAAGTRSLGQRGFDQLQQARLALRQWYLQRTRQVLIGEGEGDSAAQAHFIPRAPGFGRRGFHIDEAGGAVLQHFHARHPPTAVTYGRGSFWLAQHLAERIDDIAQPAIQVVRVGPATQKTLIEVSVSVDEARDDGVCAAIDDHRTTAAGGLGFQAGRDGANVASFDQDIHVAFDALGTADDVTRLADEKRHRGLCLALRNTAT